MCTTMLVCDKTLIENKVGKDGRILATKRVSLFLKKPLKEKNASSIASPTRPDKFEKAAEGDIPENTRHSTNWAMRTFMSWSEQCNQNVVEKYTPIFGHSMILNGCHTYCDVLSINPCLHV